MLTYVEKRLSNLNWRRTCKWAALVGVGCFYFMLWGRIGILPAASTHDDAWFNETAYYLLKEGVLRSPMHDASIGTGIRDFLPPTPALFTAVAFNLFGLTAFAAGVGPAFATSAGTFALGEALHRHGRIPRHGALAGAASVFFLPEFVRNATSNRFEAYVVLFLSLSLLFSVLRAKSGHLSGAILVLSGVFAGLSCVSHYPVAPYVLGLSILSTGSHHNWHPRRLLEFFLGVFAVALGFSLWVYPDYGLFIRQMLATGSSYSYITHAPSAMFNSLHRFGTVLTILISGGLALRAREGSGSRGYYIYALLGSIASIFWWDSLALYASISIVIGIMSEFSRGDIFELRSDRPLSLPPLNLLVLTMMFVGMTLSALATEYVSIEYSNDRNFGAFKRNLLVAMKGAGGGLVLIDRPAHLAIRASVSSKNLHHLVNSQYPQSFVDASRVLFDAGAVDEVSAIVVSPPLLAMHINDFPLVRAYYIKYSKCGPGLPVSPYGLGKAARHSGPYYMLVYRPCSAG